MLYKGEKMDYVAPECGKAAFTCPNCGAYAQQMNWGHDQNGRGPLGSSVGQYPIGISLCTHCGVHTIWHFQEMVYPRRGSSPSPNGDMPADVLKD